MSKTRTIMIDDWAVSPSQNRIERGGQSVKLKPRAMDVLVYLAEHTGEVISAEELIGSVWQGRVVGDGTVYQSINQLRQALGDRDDQASYIETIAKRGYQLVAHVRLAEEESAPTRQIRWSIIAAGAVVIVALIVLITLLPHEKELPASVAVLPFTDLSEQGDQQYFADGMAEELLNELARLEGLEVASRSESFSHRGPIDDLGALGQRLAVTHLIEGSVRKSADELRVTVQLIEVDTGYHLWSKNFDRELADIFAIQEDIARSVAAALGVRLGVGGVNQFRGAGTRSIDAYDAYLHGDYIRATELDPSYAAAWALRGIDVAANMQDSLPVDAPAIIEQAREFVEKAIELDPQSVRAHAEFGRLISHALDWNNAEESYRRALSLKRDVRTLRGYADLHMRTGRVSAARVLHEEADALERIPQLLNRRRIAIEISQGKYDAARRLTERQLPGSQPYMYATIAIAEGSITDLRAAIDSMPRTHGTYGSLFEPLYDMLESQEKVLALLHELAADRENAWPWKYHNVSLLAAAYGDPQLSFDVFAEEIRVHPLRNQMLWYPVMSAVRQLPEFKQFAIDTNLVDYWRQYGWSDFCRPLGAEDFVCE